MAVVARAPPRRFEAESEAELEKHDCFASGTLDTLCSTICKSNIINSDTKIIGIENKRTPPRIFKIESTNLYPLFLFDMKPIIGIKSKQ